MKSIKWMILIIGTTMLVLTGFSAQADVQFGIRIGPPPRFVVPGPPSLLPIPGTTIYFIPDIDASILFYHGYWYRPYNDHWFRSRDYDGPWVYLSPSRVPGPLLNLPPDYRRIPRRYERIPYDRFHQNWRKWDRDRYWDRHRDWREERGEPEGREFRPENRERREFRPRGE
jgi:hypothetical protein